MPVDDSNLLNLVITVSVFVLFLAVWLMIVCFWSSRKMSMIQRLQDRLGLRPGEREGEDHRVLRLWKDGEEATTTVTGKATSSLASRLQDLRRTAGWDTPVKSILLAMFGLSLLVFVTGFTMVGSAIIGFGMSLIVPILFWTYTQMRIKRRSIQLEGQCVEALELAARSLRAGHPLVGAFRLISEEMSPPVSLIFGDICQLQEYGADLKEAIYKPVAKSGSSDLHLFATSVAIQLESGGNLADMMYRLASVTRDRIRLRRRVGILTAQTQLSKRVLIALPFILLAGLTFLNADYMAPLFSTSIGHNLLAVAGVGMVLGIWMMNRVSQLRY